MKKLLVLMLLMLLVHPFGCKTRRIAHVERKTVNLDSTLYKQGSGEVNNMHLVDAKAVFETLSKEKHTKATYRTEKHTSREISLDGEYQLDTLKPCSGDTLNFVNKNGERAQVIKEKNGQLKLKGTQRGRVIEREISEMTLEQSEAQTQSKTDTSKQTLDYAQRRADSLLNLKYTRNEEGKVKNIDKTTTDLPWWTWLMGGLVIALLFNIKILKKWLNP